MSEDYSPEFELASDFAESAASLPATLKRFAQKDMPEEFSKHLANFSGGALEQWYRATIEAHRNQLDSQYGDLTECAGDVYSNAHAAAVALARRVLLVVWNAASPDGAYDAYFSPAMNLTPHWYLYRGISSAELFLISRWSNVAHCQSLSSENVMSCSGFA